MPMNRKLYPPDWEAIAFAIKQAANWQCQQCRRPCREPKETWGELSDRLHEWDCTHETNWLNEFLQDFHDDETGEWGQVPKIQRFTLTVAHLNHQPEDCRPENLKALCSTCHLRYDTSQMQLKKRLKAERLGQMTLL